MMKNTPLFYEARDAIATETYLKASTKTLCKYLEELNIVQPWESDSRSDGAVQRKHEWIEKITTELQRRKDVLRKRVWLIAKVVLIGVVFPLIVLILWSFLSPFFQQNDQPATKAQALKTPKQVQSIPAPLSPNNPIRQDKLQPGEKGK